MPDRLLLLGHRGARSTRSIPENTIASFDLALEQGCDGVEFDVRRTSDARAVVCHDPKVGSVDIARAQPGDLCDLPVLEEVLHRYSNQAFLDIELKVGGLESTVVEALQQHPPERGLVVSSFLPEVLRELRSRDPRIPLGLICDTEHQLAQWRRLPISCLIPHHRLVKPALVNEVHAAGLKVFGWTVNRKELMLQLSEWGVDAVISDETELLVKTLGSRRA
jgi:glycerophosphoryl diester phosphodiesterase